MRGEQPHGDDADPPEVGDPQDENTAIEQWFIDRGVPHFIERKTDGLGLDAWTRALPLLVVCYLLLGFNALDLVNWSVVENVVAALAVLVILIATWALSNRLRGVDTFARPTDIDAPELVLFVVGPAVAVLLFGQVGDAVESVVLALVMLALIYVWSSYGIGPLLRWGVRRGRKQLTGLGSLVVRALPLLLLFNTFLFINAEVWEVAGNLTGPVFFIVIAIFVLLGVAFVLSRIPGLIRGLNRFESWDDVADHLADTPAAGIALPDSEMSEDRLRLRQRANIGLVVLFGQALQITLVAAALTGFFVLFGFLAIGETVAANWTGAVDVHVAARAQLGGRDLVLSEPLLRVSIFLGAFSGMYFTVVLTTDDTYRTEFADDVGPAIRQALAVRSAYRVARGTHPQSSRPPTSPPTRPPTRRDPS